MVKNIVNAIVEQMEKENLLNIEMKESDLIITSDFSNRSLRIIFSLRHRILGSSRRAGLQMQAFPITCRLRALC